MRLLLVEDSERLRHALAPLLAGAGYALDQAADGAEALAYLERYDYAVVVLDLMLPKVDGLEVLRTMRARGNPARVLVLSARDQVQDRVAALDRGADDYLVKPFSSEELLARLSALLRRSLEQPEPELRAGTLVLDPRRRAVQVGGRTLNLSPKEFALLECLLRERGRVLSRAQLFERVYSGHSESSDKVIEVLMSTLRSKLGEHGAGELVQTRRGFGYVIES
ncbi:MAG: response regulator transcription factor [Rhodanobacteraceae bacterium]|nr:response regulator transcription factor [Rhodanobacteraceae bacterium]